MKLKNKHGNILLAVAGFIGGGVIIYLTRLQKLEFIKNGMPGAGMFPTICGVAIMVCSVLLLAILFGLDHTAYVTFLPKSITSAIGMGVSEELGGYVSLTVAVIILSGVLGNMTAEGFCKLFKITEPVARGIAIGSSSHAIGTTRALEIGQLEGAMSSLSIVISGLLTVAGAGIFARFL